MKILLMFLAITIYGTDQSLELHKNNFYGFPLEILNHIAFYLPYSNNSYETDESLIERFRQSQGMLKEAKLDSNRSVIIRDGSLEIVNSGINGLEHEKIITSIEPKKALIEFQSHLNNKTFAKQLFVRYFVLSSSYEYLAVTKEVHLFNNGTYENADIIDVFKFDERKKKFWLQYQVRCDYNSVYRMSISNLGVLALLKASGPLFVKPEGEKIVFREFLKFPRDWMSIFIKNSGLPFLSHESFKTVNLMFNKQGNKIALMLHYLYDYSMAKDQSTEKFNKLVRVWFSRNYDKFAEISYLFDMNLNQQELLNQLSDKLWNSECAKSDDAIWIKFQKGIDVSCPIKVMVVEPAEPWSLEKYFRLKGVCKKFNQQCGYNQVIH